MLQSRGALLWVLLWVLAAVGAGVGAAVVGGGRWLYRILVWRRLDDTLHGV